MQVSYDCHVTDTWLCAFLQTTALSDIFSGGVPGLKEFSPAQVVLWACEHFYCVNTSIFYFLVPLSLPSLHLLPPPPPPPLQILHGEQYVELKGRLPTSGMVWSLLYCPVDLVIEQVLFILWGRLVMS